MLDLQSGSIGIDGIDISRIPRDFLRERCFITVSQDALLLANETLRLNLDPDGVLSDESLIFALEKTGLWERFAQGHENGHDEDSGEYCDHPILDRAVSSFQELSAGQCQLFAFCRAIVKADILRAGGRMPVVLLDEVTSSLDSEVESRVHRIIDREFTTKGHTVIVVSHRLGALAAHSRPGRDVVVWMRDGRVFEVSSDLETEWAN